MRSPMWSATFCAQPPGWYVIGPPCFEYVQSRCMQDLGLGCGRHLLSPAWMCRLPVRPGYLRGGQLIAILYLLQGAGFDVASLAPDQEVSPVVWPADPVKRGRGPRSSRLIHAHSKDCVSRVMLDRVGTHGLGGPSGAAMSSRGGPCRGPLWIRRRGACRHRGSA